MNKRILFAAVFIFSMISLFGQNTVVSNATIPAVNEPEISDSMNQAYAQNDVPDLLRGIWKNRSRYVIFDTGYVMDRGSVPQVVIRAFYQWYNDRAAESNSLSDEWPRDSNNTTQISLPQQILIRFTSLTQDYSSQKVPSGAWDLEIEYPNNRTVYHVPVAVIGDDLYLDFTVKNQRRGNELQVSENTHMGFWQDTGSANGILISPPINKKELLCYFISESGVYHIRYWKTDMMYDITAEAFFSDGEENYSVPKHLYVNGNTYTCVTGRRNRIRNIEKSSELPVKAVFNQVEYVSDGETFSDSTICCLGDPYLSLVDGDIRDIVQEQNSKKKPLPPSPFPPHGILDFDWSIIEDPPRDYNRRVLDLGK